MGKEVVGGTIVGVPLVNELTQDGIITALDLENFAVGGFTVGALFKLLMLIALVLLIVERTLSVAAKVKEYNKEEEG